MCASLVCTPERVSTSALSWNESSGARFACPEAAQAFSHRARASSTAGAACVLGAASCARYARERGSADSTNRSGCMESERTLRSPGAARRAGYTARALTETESSAPLVPLLAIVGATATGKSAVALELAEELGLEIVSMDSMQVYRGMDIGTAKPTRAERARVPHACLDLVEPSE